jgi:hypothetical protein
LFNFNKVKRKESDLSSLITSIYLFSQSNYSLHYTCYFVPSLIPVRLVDNTDVLHTTYTLELLLSRHMLLIMCTQYKLNSVVA